MGSIRTGIQNHPPVPVDAAAEAAAWRVSFARALVALIPQPAGGSGVAFETRAVTAEATAARRVAEGLVAAAASQGQQIM